MQFPINLVLDEIDWDPRVALPIGQELGIAAYSLRMFNQTRYPKVSAEDQQWVENMFDKGICKFDVITPGINKDPFDAAVLDEMIDVDLLLCCERAQRLGIGEVSLFSWAKLADAALPTGPSLISPTMPFKEIVAAFRRMAELADRMDVNLSIEVGWQCWGDSGLGVAEIIRAVDHPRLRMLWDPCNSLSGRTWWSRKYPDAPVVTDPMGTLLAELDQIADLIVGVHVRDEILKPPAWEYQFLGEGQVDWKVLARALWDHGYRGALTIEHHIPAPRKAEATRHTAQFLKNLMKEQTVHV